MQYRKAFDAADVDGDNTLEEGEFELVMETLHMGHDLSQAEVRHAWQVLKTAREEGNRENHLTFMEFIVGVQKIRDDEVLGGRIDLTKPCPWEMLSLLIDTPVSEMESDALYDELSMLERLGVNMVQGTVPSIIERRPALFFLGHISPIFAPFFLVFSRFSPS